MTSPPQPKRYDGQVEPITIVVGYPWTKDGNTVVDPENDKRWQFLKQKIGSEAKAVSTIAAKRPGRKHLDIRIRRLRGRHGDMVVNAIRSRIEEADVLVLDIGNLEGTGFNSNVLIEVGVALGRDHHLRQNLYILKPESQLLPSDLNGFLVTDYSSADQQFRLRDDPGFRAALRSSILRIAEERMMIGPQPSDRVSTDDDEGTEEGGFSKLT